MRARNRSFLLLFVFVVVAVAVLARAPQPDSVGASPERASVERQRFGEANSGTDVGPGMVEPDLAR